MEEHEYDKIAMQTSICSTNMVSEHLATNFVHDLQLLTYAMIKLMSEEDVKEPTTLLITDVDL